MYPIATEDLQPIMQRGASGDRRSEQTVSEGTVEDCGLTCLTTSYRWLNDKLPLPDRIPLHLDYIEVGKGGIDIVTIIQLEQLLA